MQAPLVGFDRSEIMRRLGAHHRALNVAGDVQEFGGSPIDTSLDDEELGRAIRGHVVAQSKLVNVVGNAGYEMTLTCIDGVERTMATGGADLVNHAWWFQAQFERVLRHLSVDRGLVTGWEFDLAGRQWEVAGADRDVMSFYSQAQALVRAETQDALAGEDVGVSRWQLQVLDSRAKRKVTRAKGEETLTWGAVRARMQGRAASEGIALDAAFTSAPVDPQAQPGAWDDDVWARTVEEIVCENKGAEITARIEAAVRAFAPHEWTEEQIRDRVRDVVEREFITGQVVARGRVGVRKHASNRVTEAERRACEAFARG